MDNRFKAIKKEVKKDMDIINKPYLCQECGIKPRLAGYPVCISCIEIDDPAFSDIYDEYMDMDGL